MATYTAPVVIRTWANSNTTPDKLWRVVAIKGGIEVPGTSRTFTSKDGSEAWQDYYYELVLVGDKSRVDGGDIYDQVVIFEEVLIAPS